MPRLTPEQATALVNSAKAQFTSAGLDQTDVTVGLILINDLMVMLGRPYLISRDENIELCLWPTDDKRFPEVLRVLANLLDVKINEENRKE